MPFPARQHPRALTVSDWGHTLWFWVLISHVWMPRNTGMASEEQVRS